MRGPNAFVLQDSVAKYGILRAEVLEGLVHVSEVRWLAYVVLLAEPCILGNRKLALGNHKFFVT